MNLNILFYLKKIFNNFFKIRYKIKNIYEFELKLSRFNFLKILFFLKNNHFFNFYKLNDIVVIDFLKKKKRFKIYYLLESFKFNFLLNLTLITNEVLPIFSISKLYSNSIWLEREIWDMFGIYFLYNNDLRRLLMDYGSDGHPLKKDFPLTGFKEVFYNENKKKIVFLKLELMQEFRLFNFVTKTKNI